MVVLARTYVTSLVVNLPILAVMLIPQLTRSRAGSETLLAIGTTILVGLVVVAVIAAPEVSAWAAPSDGWRFGQARSRVRELIRTDHRTFLLRLAELVALYIASQATGGLIAWVMPYIWSDAGRWVLHYPNFAVQAITMYLVICLATAWYSTRLRQTVLAQPTPP